MAISSNKQRIAVSLQKEAVKLLDTIKEASPTPITRSQVIEFAIAEFYLSILQQEEKKGESGNA